MRTSRKVGAPRDELVLLRLLPAALEQRTRCDSMKNSPRAIPPHLSQRVISGEHADVDGSAAAGSMPTTIDRRAELMAQRRPRRRHPGARRATAADAGARCACARRMLPERTIAVPRATRAAAASPRLARAALDDAVGN